MKKFLYVLVTLSVIFIGWYCYTYRNIQKPVTTIQTNTITKSSEANLTEMNPNFPVKVPRPTQPIETSESSVEMTNALTTTNIEQWKAAIKDLKPLAGFKFKQNWMMEKTNRLDGVPVILQQNSNTVAFSARFIDINAKNETGDIIGVEIHSPIMDIDETRELGLQLCNMLGHDPSDFLAWCDKVGNHWLDAPLYDGFSVPIPNSDKFCGFGVKTTYTDGKPWYILFFITSP
jgi:hypothetical protein